MALFRLQVSMREAILTHRWRNGCARRSSDALQIQKRETIEEEMAARVNVLMIFLRSMARELGREATFAELAERMKMSEIQTSEADDGCDEGQRSGGRDGSERDR